MRKVTERSCVSFVIVTIAFLLYGCNDVSKAPAQPVPPSPDATLSALTVAPGTLQPPFSGTTTTNYTVDVTSDVTSVTATALAQNSGATISINGSNATTGQATQSVTLGAPGSSTPISIVVTAPSGSQNTYVVSVNRAALNGNNSLQSLTVSPGTFTPTFDPNTLNYSDDVGSGVSSVNVTANLQDTNASMTVNGQATSSGQTRNIQLGAEGSSTAISIVVTAQNGNQKTYSVSVNRQALGGNNNLQNLSVSPGSLSPAFGANTTNYTVNVASNVSSVNVTAILQ